MIFTIHFGGKHPYFWFNTIIYFWKHGGILWDFGEKIATKATATGCSSSVVFHSTIYACDLCGRWSLAMALMERLVAAGFKDGIAWTWGDDSWFLRCFKNELDLQGMACETLNCCFCWLKWDVSMTEKDEGGTHARKTSWFAGEVLSVFTSFCNVEVWDLSSARLLLNPKLHAIDHWTPVFPIL